MNYSRIFHDIYILTYCFIMQNFKTYFSAIAIFDS